MYHNRGKHTKICTPTFLNSKTARAVTYNPSINLKKSITILQQVYNCVTQYLEHKNNVSLHIS